MFTAPPPVTLQIIVANVAIYLLEGLIGNELLVTEFALWPFGQYFAPWQILTYGFLHGGFTHIALNMFAVYMFGSDLERIWGPRRYLQYYLACIVTAAVAQLAVTALTGAVYPTVGASGGVFGLLLAFGMFFPHRTVMLLIPPIPLPARVFVALYGALELYLGVTGSSSGVAHFAHLGGMLGGYLLIRAWRGGRRSR
jgi:membrane associated rhomboid family serine protease